MKIDKEAGEISIDTKHGVTVLGIPSVYLADESDPELKSIGKFYIDTMSRIEEKGFGSIVIPSEVDEKGNRLFYIEQPSITVNVYNQDYVQTEQIGDFYITVASNDKEDFDARLSKVEVFDDQVK